MLHRIGLNAKTNLKLCTINRKQVRRSKYFAQHLNFSCDVLYRFGGGAEAGQVTCEVQLATALSTAVWETTHRIYESTRETEEAPEDWQWNPGDPRFVSRQLGHMIHLADGLLVQSREAANEERAKRSKK